MVVADEAQQVKNPLSATALALHTGPAIARVALTGTPVENRLTDLWSIVDWTTPGLLGGQSEFRRRIAVPVERYGDADATE
jgi:SNF2 family DNA or RNA helicase